MTVFCGRSKAAATPPSALPGKQRNPRKSAARHLALIHMHMLSLSLLLPSASQCGSKDGGEEGQTCSGMSGKGAFHFLKVTRPHQTLRLLLRKSQHRGHTCLAWDGSPTSALTSSAHCLSGRASSVCPQCRGWCWPTARMESVGRVPAPGLIRVSLSCPSGHLPPLRGQVQGPEKTHEEAVSEC